MPKYVIEHELPGAGDLHRRPVARNSTEILRCETPMAL